MHRALALHLPVHRRRVAGRSSGAHVLDLLASIPGRTKDAAL